MFYGSESILFGAIGVVVAVTRIVEARKRSGQPRATG